MSEAVEAAEVLQAEWPVHRMEEILGTLLGGAGPAQLPALSHFPPPSSRAFVALLAAACVNPSLRVTRKLPYRHTCCTRPPPPSPQRLT